MPFLKGVLGFLFLGRRIKTFDKAINGYGGLEKRYKDSSGIDLGLRRS